jgi:hypothetical protein
MAFTINKETLQHCLVDTNAPEPDKAQVIILLAKHSRQFITPEQEKQELFNCSFILRHFKDGDSIWVEESANLEPHRLKCFQIPYLEIKGAKMGGWDDPEICQQADLLNKKLQTLPHTDAHRERQQFIARTFPPRQNHLFNKIDSFVLENISQLFILSGEIHGDTDDPQFIEECHLLREKLRARNIKFSIFCYKSEPPQSSVASDILKLIRTIFSKKN